MIGDDGFWYATLVADQKKGSKRALMLERRRQREADAAIEASTKQAAEIDKLRAQVRDLQAKLGDAKKLSMNFIQNALDPMRRRIEELEAELKRHRPQKVKGWITVYDEEPNVVAIYSGRVYGTHKEADDLSKKLRADQIFHPNVSKARAVRIEEVGEELSDDLKMSGMTIDQLKQHIRDLEAELWTASRR